MIGRLRRAAIFASLAFILCAALIGVHTTQTEAGLVLGARPIPLFIMVVMAALAGFAIAPRRTQLARPASPRRWGALISRFLPALLLITGIALPFVGSRYAIDTGTIVLIYIMLAFGLNIVVGLAGLLDLGYVAFYAVGAYSYAILSTNFGLGFWTCLPISGLMAAGFGVLLGFPVLRLRGDYLAVVTLGFGEIIRIVLNNFTSLTNGPRGIADIPRPTLFGYSVSGNADGSLAHMLGLHATPIWRVIFLYYLIFALALATNAFTQRLRAMPIGRAFEALREDEIACRALGIDVTAVKLAAFAIGAMFAGFAGCFFAARAAFVSPESFVFMESATVLAIVVLGGLGSQIGTALAAIIMIGGGEFLRESLLDLSQSPSFTWAAAIAGDIGQYRMLIFGMAMVGMMVLRPRGLIAGRKAGIRLVGAEARQNG